MERKRRVELVDIIDAIQDGQVRITDHAYEEANADRLKFDEIYFSALHGEVIEEYQDDSPYPSISDIWPNLWRRSGPQRLGIQ